MIDFANAKKIVIPQGEVSIIARGSEILWQKQKYKQELEYLESTGTQYIDTGLKMTSDYSVELDYQIVSIPKQNERKGLFGGLDTGGVARYGSLVSPTTRMLEYGYGKGNTYYQTKIPTTYRCLLYQNKNKVYVDNSLIYTFPTVTFAMASNAYLGSFNYTNYTPMLAKYYGAKFWDGDTLVRDFIPVLDMNDVPCMYDKVTDTCFYNKGTGQFQFEYKAEDKYQVLEYLESDGHAYIDTLINPDDTYGYKIDIEQIESVSEQCPLGCMDAGNRFVGVYFSSRATGVTAVSLSAGFGSYVKTENYPPTFTINQRVISSCNYMNDRKIVFDGYELKDVSNTHINGTISNTIHLFNRHYSVTSIFRGRMYSAIITKGNDIVADFIPCLRKSDGKVGMYDKITQQFFTNKGTGEFLYK